MSAINFFSALCLITGTLFFLAGSIGMVRFPDVYTRLHALTKADNLGLGFVVLGMAVQADSITSVLKLLLIWLLSLVASATMSFLIADRAHRHGIAIRQASEHEK
jgi:multicomponent Na+:H+ antiporter subunit G